MKFEMTLALCLIFVATLFFPSRAQASKLVSCSALDQDYLMVSFKDGDVTFADAGLENKLPDDHKFSPADNTVVRYGSPLDTAAAGNPAKWKVSSADDPAYGAGLAPRAANRVSKINGMAQVAWNDKDHDWGYESTMEHQIYLKLPKPLQQGKNYTLTLDRGLNSDPAQVSVSFDMRTNRSEALRVNLVGYDDQPGVKSADLYAFLGDGGYRDYSSFVGKPVYLVDVAKGQIQKVGAVSFGTKVAGEANGYNLTGGDVWHADFTGFATPGIYRLAVEGVGCSPEFTIARNVYHDPYEVSVRGYFYMRIGQDSPNMVPLPRRPLWIPGVSPKTTKVIITTMQPFHEDWKTFTSGDAWDRPKDWARYAKPGNPENPRATGGHSDALDWDRHLGHVSSIYDLILPYILTQGVLSDDDLGIAESGNGIPDVLDEARNEVDYWQSLRDGDGYGHGLTNPDGNNVLYQAGATAMAAWANALNCAMLSEGLRMAGNAALSAQYRDAAILAYNHAKKSKDPMLDLKQDVGVSGVRGRDFKMMAAAYLYCVTGDQAWEDEMKKESVVTGPGSEIDDTGNFCQIWGVAAYISTDRPIHYPELQQAMKAAVIREAKEKEANFTKSRPSRRATDDKAGYFHTIQNVHRTILAHLVSQGADKDFFRDALVLEADWGLGRNPINTIQMTTATTSLAGKRSVENIYTSGRDDGTPGLHPGHTPYLNHDDWAPGMVMGRPSWMWKQCYPDFKLWPKAAGYFNTRYVWSHSEFTPQQTMRGKMALYGYLYGINKVGG